MIDLFGSSIALQRLPLEGAEVYYLPWLQIGDQPETVAQALIRGTPWRQEDIVVWGKKHRQPRLVAWYGDSGKNYTYSGLVFTPLPWSAQLAYLRERVEAAAGVKFNSVLLNYYRDENDSMGFHSDDETELGPHPVIASLSLGEERTFVFKSKHDKRARPFKIKLSSGSLLIMKGDTQRNWLHGINKETSRRGPRVNLTFRQIVS